jgi:hypothetical protein
MVNPRKAHSVFPDATPLLLTTDPISPAHELPRPVKWQSAASWLLEE